VKLLAAITSALFCVAAPVAAPAQSLDLSLMSALCSDDYYEDTAGQCGAIFTIEAILAKYGIVLTPTSDDELVVLYLDDLDDMPVGSVQPRNEEAAATDEKSNAEPANEQETIASKVVTVQPPLEVVGGEAADDVTTTGPTARSIPAAANPVNDRRIE
jgi:hypothetical protein